jgi:hypothetical protein
VGSQRRLNPYPIQRSIGKSENGLRLFVHSRLLGLSSWLWSVAFEVSFGLSVMLRQTTHYYFFNRADYLVIRPLSMLCESVDKADSTAVKFSDRALSQSASIIALTGVILTSGKTRHDRLATRFAEGRSATHRDRCLDFLHRALPLSHVLSIAATKLVGLVLCIRVSVIRGEWFRRSIRQNELWWIAKKKAIDKPPITQLVAIVEEWLVFF